MPLAIVPSILAWTIAAGTAVPVLTLAAECLAGSRRADQTPSAPAPPFLVLMPAHDEAAGIEACARSVLAQLRPVDELVVIADNCSDDTADRARALGATVIERCEPELRGKGYALEFGRMFIAANRPAEPGDAAARAVLVVDADCRPGPAALPALAATATRRQAAVQAIFLFDAPPDTTGRPSPIVRISSFAFLIKNLVRQQALDRLAGAALLHGSGMAFPRAMFLGMHWSHSSLVEDLEMGLDLLLAGHSVVVEPAARVVSSPSSVEGTGSQRRRWEHGMMQTAGRYVPRLLARAVARPANGGWRLAMVALDLMVPPTVLLAAWSLVALGLVLALAGPTLPLLVLVGAQAAAFCGIARAWWHQGRAVLPLRNLRDLPGYFLWKLPLLLQFVTRREREWTRTERLP
ncbi:MAG TPA: glycosyltransferase family 2 protein [Novosphingobium sp.]|nr:glycosyltransferase family 2 protein [Novosphingobium sp.]